MKGKYHPVYFFLKLPLVLDYPIHNQNHVLNMNDTKQDYRLPV